MGVPTTGEAAQQLTSNNPVPTMDTRQGVNAQSMTGK